MGGNKSKPIAESAKTVLSRRKKLATEEVFDAISTPTTGAVHTPDEAATTAAASSSSSSTAATTRPPVVRLAKNAVDQGYVQDSTILKEMSKWDYVKTTNIKGPKYGNEKTTMASMVRHEEEQLTVDERKILTGRLSETHVLELFAHLRDKTRTHTQLADEFKLTEEIVEKLNTIARIPMVELDGDDYVAK